MLVYQRETSEWSWRARSSHHQRLPVSRQRAPGSAAEFLAQAGGAIGDGISPTPQGVGKA